MASITGPEPTELGGRPGHLHRVEDPFEFTGLRALDARHSAFPVAVFRPESRPPGETPVVVALNGMAAPYAGLAPLVPGLLDLGIACILIEAPFAGERSLAGRPGDVLAEVRALAGRGVRVTPALVLEIFRGMARDVATALRIAEEQHGLADDRRALLGVSLGALLASYAFTREGLGRRLLGTIGHADLGRFAASYLPPLPPQQLKLLAASPGPEGAFVRLLSGLAGGSPEGREADPMSYVDRVGPDRRARFLVGGSDPVVRPEDAVACAARFPDGVCEVVPGLGHGGVGFEGHGLRFLREQLGDWGV